MTRTLLLVEDDPDDAELFQLAAREAGIDSTIRHAQSGEQALALLIKNGFSPDVLILDLKMPGIGGLETLRRIRSDPRLRELLVFVLTSSDLEQDKTAVQEAGADSYFVKPSSFDAYVETAARIKSLLPQLVGARRA